ncbi:MAG: hypothetical protein E6I66_12130, partial [Chloroflexi bacterium]
SRSVTARLGATDATIFLEALAMPPLLAIVGATHVGQALAHLAKAVGYRVVVADPRTALANAERFPAMEILAAWPEEALATLRFGPSSAIATCRSEEPRGVHRSDRQPDDERKARRVAAGAGSAGP